VPAPPWENHPVASGTRTTAVVTAQPVHFAQLPRTDGIATDPSGNIFVVADATTAKVLVLLDANGTFLGQLPMPGTSITDIGTNNLVFDPVIPTLWVLKSNGDIFILNLSTGEWVPILTVRSLPVDVQGVYDVATGTIGPMDGVIPNQATYGDLAVLWRGDVLDLLVSGLSVIHPFTMRIRFVQGSFQSARVLVSTRAPSGSGGGNLPRGTASSADGTVVTTMPISGFGEFVYSFNVDFPETGTGLPAQVLGGSLSSGMTWHPDGTFYIAGQNAICGDPSSLLLIRPEGATCLPGGQLFSSDYDVAASTVVRVAYTTRPDGVWAWSQ
jgi:hypothetical protein